MRRSRIIAIVLFLLGVSLFVGVYYVSVFIQPTLSTNNNYRLALAAVAFVAGFSVLASIAGFINDTLDLMDKIFPGKSKSLSKTVDDTVMLKGNVYFPNGKLAANAKLVVLGFKGDYSADSNGFFEIPALMQKQWTVLASFGDDFSVSKIVVSENFASPIILKLRNTKRKNNIDHSHRSGDGNKRPYLDLNKEVQNLSNTSELVLNLQEWKLIHAGVQKLLFSTNVIERQILKVDPLEQKDVEIAMKDIESHWISTCEPKSKELRKTLGALHLIQNEILDDLRIKLDNNSTLYIYRLIRDVDIKRVDTFELMQLTFFDLVDTLKEVLNLADAIILQTANDLSQNLNSVENAL
ncbi:MAG TPA: hypothetical protein VLX61_16795 [Anaerolineales bacterium]|nr:hypothetical protein [Anaerolineales bacterium]